MIDFSSLESASKQLDSALRFASSELAASDVEIFQQFRNSVIQCFEYTYELCIVSMRRFLESAADSPSIVDQWEFKDMIREAAVRGLIARPEDWFEFRRLRNVSSHAYSEKRAAQVYERAGDFLALARSLLAVLKNKQSPASS
jgi:nucleotidyltransferase substrate binding protein (TIGR01987 family)